MSAVDPMQLLRKASQLLPDRLYISKLVPTVFPVLMISKLSVQVAISLLFVPKVTKQRLTRQVSL